MAQDSFDNAAQQLSAALPPQMAEIQSKSVDELLKEMNRLPLFMTTLDETDGEGGDNPGLDAMKALAYEGSRVEIAENFREQGNDCARAKQWQDAKEFYDKAIQSLKAPQKMKDKAPEEVEYQVDKETDAKKERIIEEASYVNRALCHLEKSKLFGFSHAVPFTVFFSFWGLIFVHPTFPLHQVHQSLHNAYDISFRIILSYSTNIN
jgi:hypothetical protein